MIYYRALVIRINSFKQVLLRKKYTPYFIFSPNQKVLPNQSFEIWGGGGGRLKLYQRKKYKYLNNECQQIGTKKGKSKINN